MTDILYLTNQTWDKYDRKGKFKLDYIFNIIENNKEKYLIINGCKFKTTSNRYKVFRKNLSCVKCKIKGSFFALERSIKTDTKIYHFNLYAIHKGKEILMTQDHIIPKSKGGKTTLGNLQTMCFYCNQKKGDNYVSG